MTFWMVERVGPRMRQLVAFRDCPMLSGSLWGLCGVYHCNQGGGTLWHSCMRVREQIELPFGAGSGVGPVIGV